MDTRYCIREPLNVKHCRVSLLLVVVVSMLGFQARAAQVDQENWPESLLQWGSFPDPQQEFTPQLQSLDSILLWMPGVRLPVYFPGGTSIVNIRQGGANGPIIAASDPVFIPPAHEGVIGYGFSAPVEVVPGQLYALEPVGAHGGLRPVVGYSSASYSGGRLYANGRFQEGDLIFQTGLGLVPEPSAAALLLSATAALMVWSKLKGC